MTDRRRQALVLGAAVMTAAVLGLGLRSAVISDPEPPGRALGGAIRSLLGEPLTRDLEPYGGLGTWVDAFDFVPAYSGTGEPPLPLAALDEMVDAGVRTVYLQAARDDDRALGLVVDPVTVAQWLVGAHQRGIAVVAWYLPHLEDVDNDLAHLEALRTFEIYGHRFDGIAVDIESVKVESAPTRSDRLVELSRNFRARSGGDALGAIVLPPVLLEVVNTEFWPQFPWRRINSLYDVWLPMAYWSNRSTDSGYRDGFTYLEESTRRMRLNLGNDQALVHAIGGIGDDVTVEQIDDFGRAIAEVGAVGGSIYDWYTLPPAQRLELRRALSRK